MESPWVRGCHALLDRNCSRRVVTGADHRRDTTAATHARILKCGYRSARNRSQPGRRPRSSDQVRVRCFRRCGRDASHHPQIPGRTGSRPCHRRRGRDASHLPQIPGRTGSRPCHRRCGRDASHHRQNPVGPGPARATAAAVGTLLITRQNPGRTGSRPFHRRRGRDASHHRQIPGRTGTRPCHRRRGRARFSSPADPW